MINTEDKTLLEATSVNAPNASGGVLFEPINVSVGNHSELLSNASLEALSELGRTLLRVRRRMLADGINPTAAKKPRGKCI